LVNADHPEDYSWEVADTVANDKTQPSEIYPHLLVESHVIARQFREKVSKTGAPYTRILGWVPSTVTRK
jgi:hypothetical protein